MHPDTPGSVTFHHGVLVPTEYIEVEPPDVQRPYGYARLIHEVDIRGTSWVMFDFNIRNMAWRVSRRLRQQGYLDRYMMIKAGTRIYLKRKQGLLSYAELLT